MKKIIPATITLSIGLIILLSYVVNHPILFGLRLVFIDWAVVLAALAVITGGINLVLVLARRVDQQARGWPYSLITAIAAIGTFGVGLLGGIKTGGSVLYGTNNPIHVLFEGVIVASQAALTSLVMISLVVGAVRMLRAKPNNWTILFLAVVIITLVGWLPLKVVGGLSRVREWLIAVPASAGARGILIGVSLGTLAVGLRVLTGLERPYRG